MSGNGVYQNEPRPRLCHLHRRRDFDGYGFNLHCDRNKPGQFIGKVDPNSPAESAGLQENDRIIEVNSIPVGTDNHKQVVAKIKEGVSRNGTKHPEEVILLVVDEETDEFYRKKGRVPKSTDPNVDKFETDMRDYSDNGSSSSQSSNRSIGDRSVSHKESIQSNRQYSGPNENNHDSAAISRTSDQDSETDEDENDTGNQQASKPTFMSMNSSNRSPSPPAQQERVPVPTRAENTLNFQMSAAEYRQQLSRNSRRRDPRLNQQMTMQQKYDVINNL